MALTKRRSFSAQLPPVPVNTIVDFVDAWTGPFNTALISPSLAPGVPQKRENSGPGAANWDIYGNEFTDRLQ